MPVTHTRLALHIAMCVASLGSPGASSAAAPAASAAPTAAAAPLTPVIEIGPQAELVAARLRAMAEAVSDTEAFARLEADVSRVSNRAAEQWDETARLLDGAPPRAVLDSLDGAWNALRVEFGRLEDDIDGRVQRREADLATLAALDESWNASRKRAQETDAPTALLERIDATLQAIAATRALVERRRDRVLVLQDTVSRAFQASDDSLARIERGRKGAVGRAFSHRNRPVWQVLREGRAQDAAGSERLAEQIGEWLGPVNGYLVAHRQSFILTLLLWAVLAWLLRWTGAPSPAASALLFTVVLTIPLRPESPVIVRQLVLVAGLGATLALMRPLAKPRAFASACGLGALLVVELLRSLLWVWPGLEQAALVAEFAAAAGVFLRAGTDLPGPWRMHATRLWIPRLFAAVSGLAAAAALFGLLELADFIGSGVIILACVGVVVDAIRGAASVLVSRARGRMPNGGLPRLERGTQRAFDVAALALWLYIGLDRYSLSAPATDVAARLLGARLEAGGLSLSLGGVLVFVATVLAGWLLSRLVVFVLEVGVFPRTSLPRGVPYAVSSLVRYGVLLSGFLIALATLGLDLTHLTLLVSALGLGLGFGLQQIVQNFVSGLILLFERPVQIGDAVQLGELTGLVERIGIRSSTLRTSEGAEVIVPNAQLAADRITNWTLSDRRRRISLTLSVDAREDPSRVLGLLLEVANSDPRISSEPAPEALLIRFAGPQLELELRAWTDAPDWMRVRSDLGIALHAALKQGA